MEIIATNADLVHKSNSPHYWVFTWSLPTATYSSKQGKAFATYIYKSIRKSYKEKSYNDQTRAFIKVQFDSRKSVLEVRGMIWTSVDDEWAFDKRVLSHPTIEDLQDSIKRQAGRAELGIVHKEGLILKPLSDKVEAGNWAYTSLDDDNIYCSSFFGDQEFVYLITVSILDRVIIRGLFLKTRWLARAITTK
jgi:hypothetical protein